MNYCNDEKSCELVYVMGRIYKWPSTKDVYIATDSTSVVNLTTGQAFLHHNRTESALDVTDQYCISKK